MTKTEVDRIWARLREYILDDAGKPVRSKSFDEWALWMARAETERLRVIGDTREKDWRVSTVFLGRDARCGIGPVQLFFETMVFGGRMDCYRRLYSTREEAVLGHDAVCTLARKHVPKP